MSGKNTPFALVILDGYALNPNPEANAVSMANTPVMDKLLASCPNTTLISHGERVGLPEGQMGNSEVGHLNIGAGRVVQQELSRINQAISSGELSKIASLEHISSIDNFSPNSALHLIGLVSEGGVHSELSHLNAIISAALEQGAKRIFIHAITDGRDRPPTASLKEIHTLLEHVEKCKKQHSDAEIAVVSVIGRYFAMDRDRRWERTKLAYDLFTSGAGETFPSVPSALEARAAAGQTDEFVEACCISASELSREPWIADGDRALFFNFRADRMRQIVQALLEADNFGEFSVENAPKLAKVATLTEYDDDFDVDILFPPMLIKNHLGDVLAAAKLKQLRLAETEKYPHVTYFFSGGAEQALDGESRVLIPSPKEVPTYDKKPQMSAPEVSDAAIENLSGGELDVLILNYANCDMVGHTGVLDAAIKAVETVDGGLGRVLDKIEELGGSAIVTADHGNADQMIDYETREPHTFHTMHPVPLILFGKSLSKLQLREGGSLCDIAPTICEILGLEKPAEMTGESLIK